jgi:hypothetical protein
MYNNQSCEFNAFACFFFATLYNKKWIRPKFVLTYSSNTKSYFAYFCIFHGLGALGHINSCFNDFFCINVFFRTILFLIGYLTCIIDYCTLEVEIKLIY